MCIRDSHHTSISLRNMEVMYGSPCLLYTSVSLTVTLYATIDLPEALQLQSVAIDSAANKIYLARHRSGYP